MILGLCGFAGAGKSTTAEYLVEYHDFVRLSFAQSLKDVVSAAFSWPRSRMEGASSLDREWRETPDPFWTQKLGRPFSPRIAMQYIGTDIFRTHVLPSIWIDNVIAKISQLPTNTRIVVDDVRFINERRALAALGATFITIQRVYPNTEFLTPEHARLWYNAGAPMESSLHPSEWEWLTDPNIVDDVIIQNYGSFDLLYTSIEDWLKTHTTL